VRLIVTALAGVLALLAATDGASAEPLSAEEFREQLVGVPLCGTPKTGPLAGKTVCTLHLADGSAVLAGAGLLVRGSWEAEGRKICRKTANDRWTASAASNTSASARSATAIATASMSASGRARIRVPSALKSFLMSSPGLSRRSRLERFTLLIGMAGTSPAMT
jgi:hypothetical protein